MKLSELVLSGDYQCHFIVSIHNLKVNYIVVSTFYMGNSRVPNNRFLKEEIHISLLPKVFCKVLSKWQVNIS